jgi:hypothetical protein
MKTASTLKLLFAATECYVQHNVSPRRDVTIPDAPTITATAASSSSSSSSTLQTRLQHVAEVPRPGVKPRARNHHDAAQPRSYCSLRLTPRGHSHRPRG